MKSGIRFLLWIVLATVFPLNTLEGRMKEKTGIVVILTALQPPSPMFRADHPFIFFIRENNTGSILFFGRVVDPNQ